MPADAAQVAHWGPSAEAVFGQLNDVRDAPSQQLDAAWGLVAEYMIAHADDALDLRFVFMANAAADRVLIARKMPVQVIARIRHSLAHTATFVVLPAVRADPDALRYDVLPHLAFMRLVRAWFADYVDAAGWDIRRASWWEALPGGMSRVVAQSARAA